MGSKLSCSAQTQPTIDFPLLICYQPIRGTAAIFSVQVLGQGATKKIKSLKFRTHESDLANSWEIFSENLDRYRIEEFEVYRNKV